MPRLRQALLFQGLEGAASKARDEATGAKFTEPPKPKSITALQGQHKKLEGQHQKALAKVLELEEQRAKLDKHISDAKESVAELKVKLENADAEIESRHAAGVLGDGFKGLAKVLEQFKATAVDSQAVLQDLTQLQDAVKKEQETLDAAAAPEAPAGDSLAAAAGMATRATLTAQAEAGLQGEGPAQRPAADTTFVQETRVREGGREGVQRWRRKRGIDFDLAAGLSTGEGPQAVSGEVGIGVRQQFAVAALATKCMQPHRVLSRVVNLGDRLAIDLASVYLRDGEDMSEANGVATWAASAGGFALHAGAATCRAGALTEPDFAVIADELRPFVFNHGPVLEAPTWPRSPVLLEAAMEEWLQRAKDYLLPLFDLHGDEANKFSSRAVGVRFVKAPLADATRCRWAQFSSRATRAWGGLVSLTQRADLLAARGADPHSLHSLRGRLVATRIPVCDGSEAPLGRCELAIAATSGGAAIERARARQQASQRNDAAAACKQWQAALVSVDDDDLAPPVNGDEAVEHCLKEWPPLWLDTRRRGGLEEDAGWGASELLPNLEVDDLRFLLKRCGRWAGLGWDQLHPRRLLLVAEPFLRGLIEVRASRGDTPAAYLEWLSVIVFRTEPDGGRRLIAPTCLQLRLWPALRGPIVRTWGAQHREAWYIGGELNTCERAGWAHQTFAALGLHWHCAGRPTHALREQRAWDWMRYLVDGTFSREATACLEKLNEHNLGFDRERSQLAGSLKAIRALFDVDTYDNDSYWLDLKDQKRRDNRKGLALAGAVALAAVPCLVARSRAPAGAHGEPARAAPVRALFVSVAEAPWPPRDLAAAGH
ncbi:unnamed protein product [Prorocentrum cordatum]|uniref:Uncharacterized protein n=1 Tax=Prorocentrum cordatum TaxID=2364126 RepID=A0ABN9W805_9DINO|nr:unnamed protein product [Polarella glacialis]